MRACRTALVASASTLAAFGLVFVYSASAVRAGEASWELAFLARQASWLLLGVLACGAASLIDYRRLRRWGPALGLLALGLLAAVLVPGIGHRVRGAYRWIRIGPFNMQPSEAAKLLLVVAAAAWLARAPAGRFSFLRHTLPVGGLLLAAGGLIALEPDMGTAALLVAVLGALLFAAGMPLLHGLAPAALFVPLAVLAIRLRSDYIQARVVTRIEDWWLGRTTGTGYQPTMSRMALGSGGAEGMGLGEGTAKLYYLPDAHTDFILAVIGQELGLAGTLAIVALFGILVWSGWRLARVCTEPFGRLLATGIVFSIGLQAAFNIAVVTASIPPKGISLPFVSFGGSGLVVALTGVGLLVSITRFAPRAAEADKAETATSSPSAASFPPAGNGSGDAEAWRRAA
jgi:cell division protein FtsW